MLTDAQVRDLSALSCALRGTRDPGRITELLEGSAAKSILGLRPDDLGLPPLWWSRVRTLRGWLREGDAEVRDALHDVIYRAARRAFLQAHTPEITADSSLADLVAFSKAMGALDLLDVPAIMLCSDGYYTDRNPGLAELTTRQIWGLKRSPSAYLPLGPGSRSVSVPGVIEVLVARLIAWGHARLDLHAFLAAARAATPSTEEGLAALQRDALAAVDRCELRELFGPVTRRNTMYFTHAGAGRVDARLDNVVVRIHARRPPGHALTTGTAAPWLHALALLELLELLQVEGPIGDQWRDDLARPMRLDAFADLLPTADPEPPQATIGWRLRHSYGAWSVVPVEVEPTKRGVKHRMIPKKALDDIRPGDRRDAAVIRTLRRAHDASAPDQRAALYAEILLSLVGHPRFFTDTRSAQPSPVRAGRVGLRLDEIGGGWLTAKWTLGERVINDPSAPIAPLFDLGADQPIAVFVLDEVVWVCALDRSTRNLIDFFDKVDHVLPPEVAESVIERIGGVEGIDMALAPSLEGRRVPAEPTAGLRLTALDTGVEVELRVSPAPDTRSFAPGEGPMVLRGRDDAGRWTCRRNADVERRLAIERWRAFGLDAQAPLEPLELDLGESVELLGALAAEDPPGPVAWAGERRTLSTLGASSVALRLIPKGRLLSLGGELEVDDGRLPIHQVLQALRSGRRFVQLDRERIVRIQDDLAERLEQLAAASWTDGEGGDQLSTLAIDALEGVEQGGVHIDAPPSWIRQLDSLRRARTVEPELPADLNATLRPYQADGVRWLLRLGAWGLGAVLADDMGLGKTVQALAVLLARGATGPALVVAPTSVVGSWAREASRFAPRLGVRLHHGSGRATTFDHLGVDDVLLTSWGTLVQDAEALSQVRFRTVVLDEAHAIKNPRTRRARAARSLVADFVIGLTGTPVENQPSELWSLFRVVAPGLLGAQEAFEVRFGRPIVEDPSGPARDQLARLIHPFLLRRTKALVAPELPSREEIVVDVTLDPDERAFYEGLRRAALDELPDADVGAIQILAALTRLRQAACHAGLVSDRFGDSAKLRAARRTLHDLNASGHKALVFSQFVQLLDKFEAPLVASGFRVGRLDGRTSRVAREQVVDAFQRGELDVLLLSLKAGGVGITLTAATYVLHLDPWWNPAAQDQATDRAHRIGQDQPVTVLHFITTNTVEVGIRELQAKKREMVQRLLEGAGAASRLDTEALLALIRSGGELADDLDPGERSPEIVAVSAAARSSASVLTESVATSSASAPAKNSAPPGAQPGGRAPSSSAAPSASVLTEPAATSSAATSSAARSGARSTLTWDVLHDRFIARLEQAYIQGDLAESTTAAYSSAWRRFVDAHRTEPVPYSAQSLLQLLSNTHFPINAITRASVRRIARFWRAEGV